MMIGFLGALLGAGVTLLGGVMRGENTTQSFTDILAMALLYFGWGLLVLGATMMFVGIVIHWMFLFRR